MVFAVCRAFHIYPPNRDIVIATLLVNFGEKTNLYESSNNCPTIFGVLYNVTQTNMVGLINVYIGFIFKINLHNCIKCFHLQL